MFVFPECGDKLVYKDGTKQLVVKEGSGHFYTLMSMYSYEDFERVLVPELDRIERPGPTGWQTVWDELSGARQVP